MAAANSQRQRNSAAGFIYFLMINKRGAVIQSVAVNQRQRSNEGEISTFPNQCRSSCELSIMQHQQRRHETGQRQWLASLARAGGFHMAASVAPSVNNQPGRIRNQPIGFRWVCSVQRTRKEIII